MALKWVIAEPFSKEATRLLAEWIRDGREIAAPALFTYEVTNVLFLRMAAGQLLLSEAVHLITALMRKGPVIPVQLNLSSHEVALTLAGRFSLETVYDSHYLALAESAGCDFWTADKRLVDVVTPQLPWVHWIGERRGVV